MRSLLPARRRAPIAPLVVLGLLFATLVALASPARAADPVPIEVGTPTPVTIATAGEQATFTFDAPAGQTILVHGTGNTFPFGALVTVRNAAADYVGGTQLGSSWGEVGEAGTTTANGGPYTLTVRGFLDNPGGITIRLELVAASANGGTLTPGVTKTVPLGTPGQTVDLTFEGTAGQVPGVAAAAVALQGGQSGAQLVLLRPDGTRFDAFGSYVFGPGWTEATAPLDATGTWTLRLDPQGAASGSLDLTLSFGTRTTGTLTPGTAKTVQLTPGSSARYTFTAVAGRRVTVEALSSTLHSGVQATADPGYELVAPDGHEEYVSTLEPQGYGESAPLGAGGTWTLVIDPPQDVNGGLRFVLRQPQDHTIPPSLTGTTQVSLTQKGQRALLPFRATAGQRVSIEQVSGGWTRPQVDGQSPSAQVAYLLENPATGESSHLGQTEGGYLEGVVTSSGTWRLVLDPDLDTTGSASYRIRIGTDVVTAITPGSATTVTLGAGDTATYTFTGVAGRPAAVSIESSSWNQDFVSVPMRLVRPDGSAFQEVGTPVARDGLQGYVEFGALDASGTWKLVIDPDGGIRGSERLVLRTPADVTQTITSGQTRTLSLPAPAQNAVLSYRAAAGQRAAVRIDAERWATKADLEPSVLVTFRGPAGTGVEEYRVRLGATPTASIDGPVADVAGTWTVTVDPEGATTGRVTYTPRLVRGAAPAA